MTVVLAWFLLAALLGWLGVAVWLSARGAMRWRLDLFAAIGLVGLPLFVVYFGARRDLTVAGSVFALAAWLAFVALLRWIKRPRARRDDADGGTRTPS
jgi:purine-cytosine permease-like protein